MRNPLLRASLVATLLVIAPLALAGPDNTAFKTYRFQANGSGGEYPNAGSLVDLYWTDGSYSFEVYCYGPSMGNAVSVNGVNGHATVYAVLDPDSAECGSFNYVGPPLIVNLTGVPAGDHTSQTGSGMQTYSGTRYRYNYQEDYFSESFIGAAIPGLTDYEGLVGVTRRIDRQQTK